jgi:hypothetical protein
MGKQADLVGKRFGMLEVISFARFGKGQRAYWNCRCDCGKLSITPTSNLTSGNSTSCGCVRISHHLSRSRQYKIWQSMKTRCSNESNPNFTKYGAKGIKYDPKWETFDGFWEDMQYGYSTDKTIERKDSRGPYNKDNCIWASYREQNNNRSSCVCLTHNGETKTITQWAKEMNFSRSKLYRLKNHGLTDDQIFKEMKS